MSVRSLENFKKVLKKLQDFCSEPIRNERDRAGVIQAFEFTFEQMWKALQQRAQEEGIQAASPKKALQFALTSQFFAVELEPQFSQMLEDRNLTSHTYREDYAILVSNRVIQMHLKNLELISSKLSSGD